MATAVTGAPVATSRQGVKPELSRRIAWTWAVSLTVVAVVFGLVLADGLFSALWVFSAR